MTLGAEKTELPSLSVGETFQTETRTITEADVAVFAGLTGDAHPLHTDEAYARQTRFGQRLVQGPLVYGLAVGLVYRTGALTESLVAFLGAENIRHVAPCLIGATITVDCEVLARRPTRDRRYDVVVLRYTAKDSLGSVLMTSDMSFLMEPAARPLSLEDVVQRQGSSDGV
jgi:acyl dehydratase